MPGSTNGPRRPTARICAARSVSGRGRYPLPGLVQKKNRVDPSPGYRNWTQDVTVIDRRRPGAGYRHLLRKGDVERFAGLPEDWGELSRRGRRG